MNYAEIKYCDIANGTGVRTSLFVSGCRHRCPYCFNEVAWDFSFGKPFSPSIEDALISSLEPAYISGLTVLGGEPLEPENQDALAPFLERVHDSYPHKDIWLYTGFSWEELTEGTGRARTRHITKILSLLDVMVDGRFIQAEKDITLRFRGSANQRIIDVPSSLKAGEVVLWKDDPLFATHALSA